MIIEMTIVYVIGMVAGYGLARLFPSKRKPCIERTIQLKPSLPLTTIKPLSRKRRVIKKGVKI